MKYQPNNPSSKTKQLQQLHQKILRINNQYTKRHEQWLRVKFTLIQMANKVSTQNMAINNNNHLHQKQLRDSIKVQLGQNQRVDNLFHEVFNKQYVGDVLKQSVLSTANDAKLPNKNITTDKTYQQYKNLSPTFTHLHHYLPTPSSLTPTPSPTFSHHNDQDIVRLQIQKQKHKNTMIEKQLMMLEKELVYLQGYYCRDDYDSKKDMNGVGDDDNILGQQMDSSGDNISNCSCNGNRNYSHQQQQLTDYGQAQDTVNNNENNNNNNINNTNNPHNNNDTQLQSQISCLNKLINKKFMLINQLQEQNQITNKNISELKAKQSMLLKRKLLLQVRESQLNKKLNKKVQIIQINNNNNKIQTYFSNNPNLINKPITQSIKQSATLIHQLISSSLNDNIKQQQRQSINSKFNLTV